ncbi:PLP-dependent cysteine synthase family protein [Halorubrum distributum]|uniref:PLP-dependent cysteine synthase family protein n=1 Tax=Halorubrum distributum TaxID=29283 RepID=UPI000677695C|nr:cysteine synthase family protein [Halorubrum litoreum]
MESLPSVYCPYSVDDPLLQLIGNTPIVPFSGAEHGNVSCKLESRNPTGSMKDRVALGILLEESQNGEHETVVEASSGNTAGSVAFVANRLNLDCHVTLPASTSTHKKGYVRAFDAEIHECPDVSEDHPEYYHNVADRLSEKLDAYFMNQYYNSANPEVHYEWTGPEIWSQVGDDLTHLVCPMGTGGTLSGTARFLKESVEDCGRDITIVGVDATNSNISTAFYGSEPVEYETTVEGLGKGHELPTMWFEYIDEIQSVEDEQAFETARQAAREHGLLIGPSAGAALSVATTIGNTNPDAEVLSVVCDGGEQYFDSLFVDGV